MDASSFTNEQLKNLLRQLGIRATGNKTELVERLDASFSREGWLAKMQVTSEKDVGKAEGFPETPLQTRDQQIHMFESEPGFLNQELEFMRRERDLMQRELALARRENEVLRSTPRPDASSGSSNIPLRSVSDYLCEFHGNEGTFSVWEKEVRKLRNTYDVDDNSVRLLIGAKVKGKAAAWLHSKPEYVEMDVDNLLGEMKKMFDHRPGKLLQRRKFEERKWMVGEAYQEYHHDKIILGNRLSLEEDELIEYVIDGIPDARLRDQAKVQRFTSLDFLFDAFGSITLRNDIKKNCFSIIKQKSGPGHKETSSSRSMKCYNCNQEGHYAGLCPKPKREKGSCFHCGKLDHRIKDCPAAKREMKQGSSKEIGKTASSTTALVEAPMGHQNAEHDKKILELQSRKPLTEPTREYCILFAKGTDKQYYLEALIDSGSAINIMSESTYLNSFYDKELIRTNVETNYGGINKSPLCILGMIMAEIRLQLIHNHIFQIKFIVVPDSTMTYDVLLGREFMNTPGLTITFDRSLRISYDEPVNDILNIETTELANPLDIVSDNLDMLLPYATKEELLNLLNTYIYSAIKTKDVPHEFEIDLINSAKPFYFTPRRLSWNERAEVRNIVTELQQKEIIRPSNSNFCSRLC